MNLPSRELEAAVQRVLFEFPGAHVMSDDERAEFDAHNYIAEWNRAADARDRYGNPFRENGSGALLLFKCPACGAKFTDADAGHGHYRKAHRGKRT